MVRTLIVAIVASAIGLVGLRSARAESIPLKQEAGTFVVPVQINGAITLDFTLDSGAADVSIPLDVYSTLTRTGTILPGDLLDSRVYVLADGSEQRSQRFRIRSLRIGSLELRNVVASVAPPAASLLLGQTFLSRLQSWAVDNQRGVLLIDETPAAGASAQSFVQGRPETESVTNAPDDLAEYHGHYICAQGSTDLSVRILAKSTASIQYAVFTFGSPERAATIPHGSFSMEGKVDMSGGAMTLLPTAWIERPAGYLMVGLKGSSEDGGKTFSGEIVGGFACGNFFLVRVK